MKYRLFTAADPSDSKKIGVSDTINVLPEINKQGQLCWRSRPGLKNEYNFGGNGGNGGVDCLYDGTEFLPQDGWPAWDVINNTTGTYSCTPGARPQVRIITDFAVGTLKTCYFIYKVVGFADPEPICGPSVYLRIQNGYFNAPFATLLNESTAAYINIDSDRGSLRFVTGYSNLDCQPVTPPAGTVYIECIMIRERDWVTAGEDNSWIYYP